MPNPYSLDLRWRVVWLSLSRCYAAIEISQLLHLSERTVRRYITMFQQTGDVEPKQYRHGPLRLLGDFEQLTLLQIILQNPGIYQYEVQSKLRDTLGVLVLALSVRL